MLLTDLRAEYGPYYSHMLEVSERIEQAGPRDKAREIVLAGLENYLPLRLRPGDTVLDVGCGIGVTGHYLQYGGVGTVGIDINPFAIQKAHELWGSQRRNTYINADATVSLPFADNSFDAVRTQDLLEHLPDEQTAAQVFAEMERVCNGGRMVHLITVLEEEHNMHADPTHHIKQDSQWWREFFATRGWNTVRPTTEYLPRIAWPPRRQFHRHGFFVLQKAKN